MTSEQEVDTEIYGNQRGAEDKEGGFSEHYRTHQHQHQVHTSPSHTGLNDSIVLVASEWQIDRRRQGIM